jgi:ankyrin repeat protein
MRQSFKYIVYLIIAVGSSLASAQSYESFFMAVNRDDGRTVSQLLDRGFDPNSRDPHGQTALHLAMRDSSPAVAEALWKSKELDVKVLNQDGESALMLAALRGNLEWVQRLLDRGAKVNEDGWAPIHYAAAGPEPRVLALLLERGALLEAKSPNRTTPLMMASGYGAEGNVDLLLARGAERKVKNDRGFDAAAFARQAGRDFLLPRLVGNAQP